MTTLDADKTLECEEQYYYLIQKPDGSLVLEVCCQHSFMMYMKRHTLTSEEQATYRTKGTAFLRKLADHIQWLGPDFLSTESAGEGGVFKAKVPKEAGFAKTLRFAVSPDGILFLLVILSVIGFIFAAVSWNASSGNSGLVEGSARVTSSLPLPRTPRYSVAHWQTSYEYAVDGQVFVASANLPYATQEGEVVTVAFNPETPHLSVLGTPSVARYQIGMGLTLGGICSITAALLHLYIRRRRSLGSVDSLSHGQTNILPRPQHLDPTVLVTDPSLPHVSLIERSRNRWFRRHPDKMPGKIEVRHVNSDEVPGDPFVPGSRYTVVRTVEIHHEKFECGERLIFCRAAYSRYDGCLRYFFDDANGRVRVLDIHDKESIDQWKQLLILE